MKTGAPDVDSVISYLDNKINIIYGKSATGKTTLSLIFAISQAKEGKKVLFFDVENSFSVERVEQLGGKEVLDKILVMKVKDFDEQCKKICSLEKLKNINTVIVDTIGIHYRDAIKKDYKLANSEMNKQMKVLSYLASRGVNVLITNQVYTNIDTGEVKVVGGGMMENFGDMLIELVQGYKNRILRVRKPENKEFEFEIVSEGIRKLYK